MLTKAKDRTAGPSRWDRVVPGRAKAREREEERQGLLSELCALLDEAARVRSGFDDLRLGWDHSRLSEEDTRLDASALEVRLQEARAEVAAEERARAVRDQRGREQVEGALRALEVLSGVEVGPGLLRGLVKAHQDFVRLESFSRVGLKSYLVRHDVEVAEELLERELKRLRDDPASREQVLKERLRGARTRTQAAEEMLEASLDALVADLVVLRVKVRAHGVHSRVLELRPGVVLCTRTEALGGGEEFEFHDWAEVGDLSQEELETFLVLVADSDDAPLSELKESAQALG